MTDRLRESYDALSEAYAEALYGELAGKPLDRWLLARLAEEVSGPLCDLGCGPGHVAAFLRALGADALGIDLSPGMVCVARARCPQVPFRVGDMRALDVADGAWGGVAMMYALVHTEAAALADVLCEVRRALRPGGLLLAAVHLDSRPGLGPIDTPVSAAKPRSGARPLGGIEEPTGAKRRAERENRAESQDLEEVGRVEHVDELFGCPVDLDFVLFPRRALAEAAVGAGFALEEDLERGPYLDREYPSRRAYVLARA